ncbi:hypothetical protein [Pseudooceanicola atlanticus]|uniref:Lipoprotein n=1 Tax=Pseudooceanicola atlanticus TaxID=1461694 RepID=A0A0A0EFF5_9RHOB|nr:hypothetical protein [Pseudooceanicola atlanticus]KGM48813.1 hypothetical protein ATO9_08870 [Pseudooceanicola atlanticus]
MPTKISIGLFCAVLLSGTSGCAYIKSHNPMKPDNVSIMAPEMKPAAPVPLGPDSIVMDENGCFHQPAADGSMVPVQSGRGPLCE